MVVGLGGLFWPHNACFPEFCCHVFIVHLARAYRLCMSDCTENTTSPWARKKYSHPIFSGAIVTTCTCIMCCDHGNIARLAAAYAAPAKVSEMARPVLEFTGDSAGSPSRHDWLGGR